MYVKRGRGDNTRDSGLGARDSWSHLYYLCAIAIRDAARISLGEAEIKQVDVVSR
jgi:hypothetical protein